MTIFSADKIFKIVVTNYYWYIILIHMKMTIFISGFFKKNHYYKLLPIKIYNSWEDDNFDRW
jgi:hypothetical protein